MSAIRISSRLLVVVAIAAALCVGFVVGESQQTSPVAAAPVAQGAPTETPTPAATVTPAPQETPAVTPTAAASQPAPTTLNLDLSMRLMQAAVTAANQANVKESFSIVDVNGNELMMAHMDGANFLTPDLAKGKANATAAIGIWGAAWPQRISQNPSFFSSLYGLGRPIVTAQGSIPIMINGVRVGAMGAAGGTSQQDEDFVRAAFNGVGLTPPTQ